VGPGLPQDFVGYFAEDEEHEGQAQDEVGYANAEVGTGDAHLADALQADQNRFTFLCEPVERVRID
jgi:hypothetical protein